MSLLELEPGLVAAGPTAALRQPRGRTVRRLLGHRLAFSGLLILALLALGGLLAPVLAPEHPNQNGIWIST